MKQFNLIHFLFIGFLVTFMVGCSNEQEEQADQDEIEDSNGGDRMKPEELPGVFLDEDYERIYKQMSEDFQNEVSLEQLQKIGDDFNQDVNTYIFQSELPIENGVVQYTWVDDGSSKGMVAVFDESGVIMGLRVLPLQTYPETDEVYTKTTFNLPFENEWFVFWGGTNSLVNYHYDYENQRYAFDFLIRQGDSTYDGDPALNESYYAFGETVVAPADGEVVEVESGIKDNEPVGEMNEENPAGNYVIIDHGNDEYSLLAHFKYDSIEVEKGVRVKEGDILGSVGNSGNSSEAHIHFHVADSPDLGNSTSIRIDFNHDEDLIQGDVVTPK